MGRRDDGEYKTRKHRWAFLVFFIFFLIIAFLIYTAFSDAPFTGSVIGIGKNSENSGSGEESNLGIYISAGLTVPDMELEGEFPSVRIDGGRSKSFVLGNEKDNMGESSSLLLQNLDGDIEFVSGFFILKGKTDEALINGLSVEHKSGKTIKVNSGEDFDYGSLEVEGARFKKVSYSTSGNVRLSNGKSVFNVDNEAITIKNFVGD